MFKIIVLLNVKVDLTDIIKELKNQNIFYCYNVRNRASQGNLRLPKPDI